MGKSFSLVRALNSIGILVLTTALSSQAFAGNTLLEKMEKGEVLAAKSGSAFVLQALVKKEPEKLNAAFQDLRNLPKFFKNVSFVQPYSTADGKRLVYLKLRGLSDGLGVLMEVKQGGLETFNSSTETLISGQGFQYRDSANDVDVQKDPAVENALKEVSAQKEKPRAVPEFQLTNGLILEGPLNEILEMPALRLTVNIAWGPYTISQVQGESTKVGTPKRFTWLVSKTSFGQQVVRGQHGGDIGGFGDRSINLAQQMGVNVMRLLRGQFENL